MVTIEKTELRFKIYEYHVAWRIAQKGISTSQFIAMIMNYGKEKGLNMDFDSLYLDWLENKRMEDILSFDNFICSLYLDSGYIELLDMNFLCEDIEEENSLYKQYLRDVHELFDAAIDTSRFTKNTNIVYGKDSDENGDYFYIDICYDNDNKNREIMCDVENLVQSKCKTGIYSFACGLARRYGVAFYDTISDIFYI